MDFLFSIAVLPGAHSQKVADVPTRLVAQPLQTFVCFPPSGFPTVRQFTNFRVDEKFAYFLGRQFIVLAPKKAEGKPRRNLNLLKLIASSLGQTTRVGLLPGLSIGNVTEINGGFVRFFQRRGCVLTESADSVDDDESPAGEGQFSDGS